MVATILPESISEFFGPEQMWLVVGVSCPTVFIALDAVHRQSCPRLTLEYSDCTRFMPLAQTRFLYTLLDIACVFTRGFALHPVVSLLFTGNAGSQRVSLVPDGAHGWRPLGRVGPPRLLARHSRRHVSSTSVSPV